MIINKYKMGASISKNTINSMIDSANNVISNYENTCTSSGTSTDAQVTTNGCNFDNTKIIVGANTYISQTCIQNIRNNNSLQSSVTQQMQQSAQAITQQFGFPSVAAAENFINDSITLGNEIVTNYYNKCVVETAQSNAGFTCKNSTFNNSVVQVESFQSITQQCLQNTTVYNTIISKMQQDLSQTSLAKQQDTFFSFVLIILFIIGIIAYAGISLAENPLVQWGIVFAVAFFIISSIIYSVIAQQKGNYPYTKS